MRHRHPPISQETPTLCTAQSRGFFFLLWPFAPSAHDSAQNVGHNRNNNSRAATLVGLTNPPHTAIVSLALGAFFEDLAVFFRKLRGSGRNLRIFLPKVRRSFPPLRPFSAQRVAMCKKIPRYLSDSGGVCCGRAPRGNEGRGAGLALGAGTPCPVRNAIYLFSLGRIEWCRADPDLACFYCKGRNPRSNYLRLRS